MNILIRIMVWVLFLFINVGLAWWNNKLRLQAIATKSNDAIQHGWQGFLYFILCSVPFIASHFNWFFLASLLLLHISIFPVAFNLYSGVPTFNLSKTSTALTDRFMVWLGLKDTEDVNICAMALSMILIFI